MVIRVYWASVTGSRKIDGEQTRLRYLIQNLKLESQWIDITTNTNVREQMRRECGNPKAIPPQIFKDDVYLGDSAAMEEFVEQERTHEFFRTDKPANSSGDSESPVTPVITQVTNSANITTTDDPPKPDNQLVAQNGRPITPDSGSENVGPSKPADIPPPTRKSVLARVGTFESIGDPETKADKPKVVFTKSKNTDRPTKQMDEERRRRILGLSATANESDQQALSNGVQS